MLGTLGVRVSGGIPNVGRTIAFRGGKRYRLNLGGPALLATGMLRLRDKVEAGKFFAAMARTDLEPLQHMTLQRWLDEHVPNRAVRDLAEALFRVSSYANAPHLASAGAHFEQLRAAGRKSVRYIDGGWQTIVEGLRAEAWDRGARLLAGSRVRTVAPTAGGWRVETAAGEALEVDAVILAVGPQVAAKLVVGAGRPALESWAKAAVPVQAAILDVALSRAPLPRQTYALGMDRPLYYSLHSAVAKLAPEGGAVIHAAMYLDPAVRHDSHAVEAELESLLDRVQPGWGEVLVHRRFLPHMNVSNAFVTAEQGGLKGRPGPAVPGAEGLFVAGDWVGPRGMLADAALASGMEAARLALAVCIQRPEAVAVAVA
jgi:phytoene dehydrogenase-like protein